MVAVEGVEEEPDFQGLFGRPGMMKRVGFGNLVPFHDLVQKKIRSFMLIP